MKNTHKILSKIGMTEKESSVYLICHQYGQATAGALSRMTGIPRSSIYDIISKLIKKGYIKNIKKQNTSSYMATNPQDIYIMLNEKKNILEEQVDEFKDLLPYFDELRQFKGTVPDMQYSEGRESLEIAFQKIARATYSYSIFSVDDLLKHVYHDIDHLFENLSNQSIQGAKRIVSYSDTAKKYLSMQDNPNIQRKMLPQGYEMAAEITLYDGVLLQMSFGEHPSILEMQHPVYYKAHKTIFEYIRNSI